MMERNVIKVDVSCFHPKKEERIRSIGLSDIRFVTIGDMIDYLMKDYKNTLIGETISLYIDNCLLPPWETAQILQPGDCIKVARNHVSNDNGNELCDVTFRHSARFL